MSNSINCVKRSYKHHNFCKHLRRTWPASHSLASNRYLASVFDPRAWLPWTPKIPEIYTQILVALVSMLGDFTRLGWAHDLLISRLLQNGSKGRGAGNHTLDIHTFLRNWNSAVIRPRDVIYMILLTNNVWANSKTTFVPEVEILSKSSLDLVSLWLFCFFFMELQGIKLGSGHVICDIWCILMKKELMKLWPLVLCSLPSSSQSLTYGNSSICYWSIGL